MHRGVLLFRYLGAFGDFFPLADKEKSIGLLVYLNVNIDTKHSSNIVKIIIGRHHTRKIDRLILLSELALMLGRFIWFFS